jgi:hypothetical protein
MLREELPPLYHSAPLPLAVQQSPHAPHKKRYLRFTTTVALLLLMAVVILWKLSYPATNTIPPMLVPNPSATVAPTPSPTLTAGIPIHVSDLFPSELSRVTVPASAITFQLTGHRFASSPLASLFNSIVSTAYADAPPMTVYSATNPYGYYQGQAARSTKDDIIKAAARYGFSQSNIVFEETTASGYSAYFAKDGNQLRLPDFIETTGEFRAHGQDYRSSNVHIMREPLTTDQQITRAQTITKAQDYVTSAKVAESNLDWSHAYSTNRVDDAYKQVYVPIRKGATRVLTETIASTLLVNFDLRHQGYEVAYGNGTLDLHYASLGTFPLISQQEAGRQLSTTGGYVSCLMVTTSNVDARNGVSEMTPFWDAKCSHYAEARLFSAFGGTLSSVQISSVELVYASLPAIKTTANSPDYYLVPTYLFTGTTTPSFDDTKLINGPSGEDANWATQLNQKNAYIYLMVPALSTFMAH